MRETAKLRLICCAVGMTLWTVGVGMLCLMCYKAPGASAEDVVREEWCAAFAAAQRRGYAVGAVCGLIVGWAICQLFLASPADHHRTIKPENRGKMFGTAPTTKAEVIVPYKALGIGVPLSLVLAVLVLPRLDATGVLQLKSIKQILVPLVIETAIVTVPILMFSVAIFAKISRGRRMPGSQQKSAEVKRAIMSGHDANAADQAVKATPNSATAWTALGLARARSGKPVEAVTAFRKAQELDPANLDAILGEADVCREAKAFDRLVCLFSRAAELRPGEHSFWHNLGVAALNTFDVDAARRAFQQALELAPQDQSSRQGLQEVESLERQKQVARASGMSVRRRGSDGRFREL